jgi:hypothetical protein
LRPHPASVGGCPSQPFGRAAGPRTVRVPSNRA